MNTAEYVYMVQGWLPPRAKGHLSNVHTFYISGSLYIACR